MKPLPGVLVALSLLMTAEARALADEITPEINQYNCVAGTSFKRDCNTCFCYGDGRASCTLMGCLKLPIYVPTLSPRECGPGARWKEDCNDCFCSNGRKACTDKLCGPAVAGGSNTDVNQLEARDRRSIEHGCIPGKTYKRDCNTCFCNENGQEACTLMLCLPALPTPGYKPVLATSSGRDRRSDECTHGTTYKRDCNTCVCYNGQESCTRAICGISDDRPVHF